MAGLMDASLRQAAAAAAETDQQARQLLLISEAMDGIDVAAGSTDGAVQVSVDRNGALTDVRFADHAMRLGPAELASAVLAAVRAAKSRIGPRYEQIVRSCGADDATATHMVDWYRDSHPDRFAPEPVVPAEPPEQVMTRASTPPPPPPARPRREPVADEDDMSMPVMQRANDWQR